MAATEAEVVTTEKPVQSRYLAKHDPATRAQAVKLVESGSSLTEVSKRFNVPVPTIAYWAEAASKTESLENPINLANKFERAAHLFVGLAMKRAKKASFAHLMTGAGIAVDKMQLLRGQPTSIHEERTIDSRQVLVLLQDSLASTEPPEKNVTPTEP